MNNKRNNLDRALGLFIEAMRLFLPVALQEEYGKAWDQEYYNALSEKQQRDWDNQAQAGKTPDKMIDYHTLGVFAIRHKHVLKKIFGRREAGNLPTKFNEIADARNILAHFDEWDDDKADLAFSHMLLIAKSIGMSELEEEIRNLKNDTPVAEQIAENKTATLEEENSMVAWFNNVKPHLDIRQGNLDESVFAANLAEVSLGTGREVYNNQSLFFSKTYFTQGLTNIANRVIKGLNGNEDGENRVISLQTGFGGGKTHTLISLYHLAKAGKHISTNTLVCDKLGTLPNFEKANIAVFTNTTNDPVQGRKFEGIHIKTIWGELAYQLGGQELYEKIRPNDEARTAPKGLFAEILTAATPALILIDELADYCVAASGVAVGGSTLSDQTISFMQEFTEAVAKVKDCVAVVTLPASVQEVANSPQAAAILQSLKDRVARVGADTRPVAEEEIFEVIRYRLFEGVGNPSVTEGVINAYSAMYQNLWSELPGRSNKSEYAALMKRSYPFHPELINIFKNKWASHPQFQRTRGVLRILASIVSDLWKRRSSLVGHHALIHPSHLQMDNLDTLTGEIKKLYGMGYDAVISSDICGGSSNAYQIDQDKPTFGAFQLTQGISTSIFLNSFGSSGVNKGISIKELKLQLLVPQGFNHNSINSCLDELQNKAYYLYYSQVGAAEQRFWYHTKPNLNILIINAQSDIKEDRIENQVIELLEARAPKINRFKTLVNPKGDIPELKRPTLIVMHPRLYHNGNKKLEQAVQAIALKKGNSDRIYRNTLLFLSISQHGRASLYTFLREYLACLKIKEEYQTSLEADQKSELKIRTEEAQKSVLRELVTAYNRVHKYIANSGVETLELKQFANTFEQQVTGNLYELLKEEEWLLEKVGHNTLRKNNLLPEDGQPIATHQVLEVFLRYDDKPMIGSADAIKDSLLKYCYNRQFAIGSRSSGNWTKMYFGETIPMFEVEDETFWLVSQSDYDEWSRTQVKETKGMNPIQTPSATGAVGGVTNPPTTVEDQNAAQSLEFSRLTISGKANAIAFNQLFNSFIMPLKENGVEIEFRITAKTNSKYPLTADSQQYKIVKESARQLGFELDEE